MAAAVTAHGVCLLPSVLVMLTRLMFSRFFIDRPIFATVLSIVITLAGGLAMWNLPLAQYPQVTPPTVQVSCTYPGASAQVVAETVAAPIEQQVNGVERMYYMESSSANDGSYNLSVTFEQGMDLNLAQVLGAEPREPGLADAAGRHQADRRDDAETGARHPHVRQRRLAPRPLRPALPEQLRADVLPRRAAPPAGDQRHLHRRPARLQHADLGRPGQARRAEPHGRRRGGRAAGAERGGGLRADRRAAGAAGAGDADPLDDPRPAEESGAVRRRHPPAPRPTAASSASATWAAWSWGPRTRT